MPDKTNPTFNADDIRTPAVRGPQQFNYSNFEDWRQRTTKENEDAQEQYGLTRVELEQLKNSEAGKNQKIELGSIMNSIPTDIKTGGDINWKGRAAGAVSAAISAIPAYAKAFGSKAETQQEATSNWLGTGASTAAVGLAAGGPLGAIGGFIGGSIAGAIANSGWKQEARAKADKVAMNDQFDYDKSILDYAASKLDKDTLRSRQRALKNSLGITS